MSHLDKDDLKLIEEIVKKHSAVTRNDVLAEVDSKDKKNTKTTEIQWNTALGFTIILASATFVNSPLTNNAWFAAFLFLCGYVIVVYPGLQKFYKKHFNKTK